MSGFFVHLSITLTTKFNSEIDAETDVVISLFKKLENIEEESEMKRKL